MNTDADEKVSTTSLPSTYMTADHEGNADAKKISTTSVPSALADGSHAGLSQWSSLISHQKPLPPLFTFFFNATVELRLSCKLYFAV